MKVEQKTTLNASPKKNKENTLLNLAFNIIIPALIMMKGHKYFDLSPASSLVISLFFPISYGVYDFIVRKKYNFLSILGFVSILLTGGIGLLQLPKEYIAIKEAAVPFVIGIAVLISLKTPYPLIRTILLNENIVNTEKVRTALKDKNNVKAFDKLMLTSTWMVTGSFMLSSTLNYLLAAIIIKSDTGTEAFNEELGKMTILSYPVIAVPCTIIMVIVCWRLFSGIKKLTGLELEEILHVPS